MPVDVSDWDGTALYQATRYNQTDAIKRLLHAGADVNRQNRWGNTPFHNAALNNNIKVARLLVDKGADINLKNNRNKTPLDNAFEGSEVERLLLELQRSAP